MGSGEREMVKRKIVFRRKKKENRLSMVMVTMAVLMLLIVISIKSVALRQEQAVYDEKIEALNSQIEQEQMRTAEIEEYGKYTQTMKYVEEVAKDKLGLVYEGEIIFRSED